MLKMFFERLLKTKSIAVVIAFIIIINGLISTYLQIKAQGYIDIKSSVISGKIQSGDMGLLLIFLGTFIVLFCLAIPTIRKKN